MDHTVSLKLNHEFRRLYAKGKSAVNPCMAVYCRKNRLGYNRLGFTTGTKLGKAVVRNRVRRQLREMYRLHLPEMKKGYDVILVGRVKAVHTPYAAMDRQYVQALRALELREDRT